MKEIIIIVMEREGKKCFREGYCNVFQTEFFGQLIFLFQTRVEL